MHELRLTPSTVVHIVYRLDNGSPRFLRVHEFLARVASERQDVAFYVLNVRYGSLLLHLRR